MKQDNKLQVGLHKSTTDTGIREPSWTKHDNLSNRSQLMDWWSKKTDKAN